MTFFYTLICESDQFVACVYCLCCLSPLYSGKNRCKRLRMSPDLMLPKVRTRLGIPHQYPHTLLFRRLPTMRHEVNGALRHLQRVHDTKSTPNLECRSRVRV